MVTDLPCLTDGLADVAGPEVTHVAALTSALAVLVRQELDAPSLDGSLPSLALGYANDVDLLAGLVDVVERNLSAELFSGPLQLGGVVATYQSDFHDLGGLAGHALDEGRLGGDDESNLAEVGILH